MRLSVLLSPDDGELADLESLPNKCLPSENDTSTGSEASVARMKAWLEICTSSHPTCNRGAASEPILPTRVIAVGSEQAKKVFLVSGAGKRGSYATLSHCWGTPDHRPLTTTKETLLLREQGIRLKKLPKTFKDAVKVCRALGIDYLWIDSLCIIQDQDSREDWAAEAPKIGDVYGNSTLTIFASMAADSSEGLFRERLGRVVWPCPVNLFGRQCYVTRHPTQDEEKYGDPGDIQSTPLQPLYNRAWVLQEQVMSRRSLMFTDNRLIWRCKHMTTNEKYPVGMPHAPNITSDNSRLLHCIINKTLNVKPGDAEIDVYTCWYRMVGDFTSRKLSYDDDKLLAIAGIAKRFAQATDSTYHAGVWKQDLLIGLLWHSTISSPAITSKATRAPSWSWASSNSAVNYSSILSAGCDALRMPISALLEISTVRDTPTSPEHPFGMHSNASLKMSGALFPLVSNEAEDTGLSFAEQTSGYLEDIEDFVSDHWGLDPSAERTWFCLPVCVRHDPYQEGLRSDPTPYIASWKRSLTTGVDEHARRNTVFCLVLQPVLGQPDTYTRVGACRISDRIASQICNLNFQRRNTFTLI